MKKAEFVELVKECGGYESKKSAEIALDSVLESIVKVLEQKDTVEIVGFGKFETALLKGKEGKVPGTDKTYKTEDKFIPKFKAGKSFKERIEKIK